MVSVDSSLFAAQRHHIEEHFRLGPRCSNRSQPVSQCVNCCQVLFRKQVDVARVSKMAEFQQSEIVPHLFQQKQKGLRIEIRNPFPCLEPPDGFEPPTY